MQEADCKGEYRERGRRRKEPPSRRRREQESRRHSGAQDYNGIMQLPDRKGQAGLPSRLPGLSRKFNIYVGTAFVLFAILMVMTVNLSQRSLALDEARQKARILLERNLATHHYFSKELKPSIFSLVDNVTDAGRYFDPAWMSSTYAVRRIDEEFKQLEKGNAAYYYKECAINARSPLNEADGVEHDFILRMRNDPALIEQATVRTFDGVPFYVVLRRGESMEESCLRCHSRPEAAPSGLIARYGPLRSFGRRAGDVVSAISIRIPLEAAYSGANRLSAKLGGILLVALVTLFLVQQVVARRFLLEPVALVSQAADEIASDERKLGQTVHVPEERELASLATAFNSMSTSLSQHRNHLEELVEKRTLQYREANKALEAEIGQRKAAELELQEKYRELEEARGTVRVLSGLLPICMSCKKIRNDDGYWDVLESYISRHSEAEFSHGICEDCIQKLYPDHHRKS